MGQEKKTGKACRAASREKKRKVKRSVSQILRVGGKDRRVSKSVTSKIASWFESLCFQGKGLRQANEEAQA